MLTIILDSGQFFSEFIASSLVSNYPVEICHLRGHVRHC